MIFGNYQQLSYYQSMSNDISLMNRRVHSSQNSAKRFFSSDDNLLKITSQQIAINRLFSPTRSLRPISLLIFTLCLSHICSSQSYFINRVLRQIYLTISEKANYGSEFLKSLFIQILCLPKSYKNMQATKPQPYFIELYSSQDKSLKNKFKFVFAADTVKELRSLIREKLIAKQELAADGEIVLKDNDDFELASDDEVKDVLADAKVRIYLKNTSPAVVAVQPVVPVSVITSPSVSASNVPVAPVVPVVPVVATAGLVCSESVLDLSTLKLPSVAAEEKHRLKIVCPQIRKATIELPIPENIISFSYLQLSNWIITELNLAPTLKAILFNHYGQPILYNLDLLHLPLPKIDFDEIFHIVFTTTSSTTDQAEPVPASSGGPLSQVAITWGTQRFDIDITLDDTVALLKYKIFEITKVVSANQIVKFAGKPLVNGLETLRASGLADKSILEFAFKLNSNLVPCTFADKFYYKDLKHTREQTPEGITELRSSLLVLSAHLSEQEKLKMVTLVRGLTQNMPLVFALKCLFNNNFLSQAHRIALEEGWLMCLSDFARSCKPEPTTILYSDLFSHSRRYIDYLLELMPSLNNLEEIRAAETCVELQVNCHFTMKPITIPRLVKLDTGDVILVNKEGFEEQLLKGFTFPSLKSPTVGSLFATKDLEEIFFQFLTNQLDNVGTNALYWIGFSEKHPQIAVSTTPVFEKDSGLLEKKAGVRVHQPLEIKNLSNSYLLLKTKQGKLRVFVSKNKDIAKPYNIFDVLTGEETAVNLDLMSANVSSENVEEVVASEMKPVITRDPKEAIAVLLDVSGSMSSQFFQEPDLKRIGAVKSFFEAFAYRTIAYNLEHVVSLFLFDHNVENKCGFTEAIYDFNRMVSQAAPRGSTLMFDAIMYAAAELRAFKIRYPDCILRIIALTDGEDTGSRSSIEDTSRELVEQGIIIDSFAVGANCDGLKIVSKATGGKCYLTRNLEESLKLFEQETVLSVRARSKQTESNLGSLSDRITWAKAQPFDLPNNVHSFQVPVGQGGQSAKDMVKKLEGAEQSKKVSGNNSLKRLAKEISNYSVNPHPFVAIFPCADMQLWKMLLLGPKDTPYENGLFLLYAQFPNDYPFRAPTVRFITRIYHCNMNSQGRICHSIFDRNYSPAVNFRQIIDAVYGLILTPEPEDPLDNVVASFYLSDYQTYLKNARSFTLTHASLTVEGVVEELFGKIVDDCERKQKEKEIEDWIITAKASN